jgi:predicted metal-dependent HD superfamily phosphohydrolase
MKPLERDQIIRKNLAEVFVKASHAQLNTLFNGLNSCYGEKHRAYHTLERTATMLKEAENFPLDEPKPFKAAILFHLVVFAPKNSDKKFSNEELSAQVCETTLARHGICNKTASRATDLIRMTQRHVTPNDDYEATLLMDLDRAVLASGANKYNRYALGIAREYIPSIGAKKYRESRSAFLKQIANGEQIFKTLHYTHLNEVAQNNAYQELEKLDLIIQRAAPSITA